MKKKNLLLFVIPMLLVLSFSLFAQDNSARISSGRAPYVQPQSVQYPMNLLNYNSRAFGYDASGGTVAVGPFKMWLSMPFGMTSLFTDPLGAEFVGAGSLANGIWYGARYEVAPLPTKLVRIDTSTGVITFITNITGATSVTGLAWDSTTNTMYASDYGTSNKLGTINLSTGVFTPLAGVVGTGLLIDIACSNNGTIYGNMITTPTTPAQIYTINKTTGVGTALPQNTGYNANYAQGMSWDHAVDSGYLAAYNYTTSAGELRKIDPATGATTLIGTLGAEVDGFVIPNPGVAFTHDYSIPNFLSLPTEWVKNTLYNVKAKVQNSGTSPETNVPVKFFVNGVLTGTPVNFSLAAGGVDSVSFPWTPLTAGPYTLKIASALTTDGNRSNDTATINITVMNSALQTIFCDDFTTTSNWTLTTAGGTVPWSSTASYTRYTMPSTAIAPGLGCDVDLPGSGNSSNAIATLTTGLNCTGKTGLYLSFDSDWNTLGTTDIAITEMSTDNGATWTQLASWNVDRRNATEILPMTAAENQANVKIRFTAIQPGWDYWWVIDNVCVKGYILTGTGNNNINLPFNYSLSQNYPNPFNPTTSISYSLKANGFVTLKVYDVLGKEVITLVNETKSAGTYIVNFNGSKLSSGVYFYKIEANEFTDIKRMMLIK